MNTNQLQALLSLIIASVGTSLASHGIMSATQWQGFVGGALILISWIWNHWHHSAAGPGPSIGAATSAYAKLLIFGVIMGLCLASSACNSLSTASVKAAVTNPSNIAQATQDAIGAAGAAVLANNPSYAAEVGAIADGLVALAQSNPGALTLGDIQAVLAKMSLDPKVQNQIAAAVTFAEGRFLSDFTTKLPTLKPTYQLFLTAVANGLYLATGHAALPLPALPAPTPAAGS